MARAKGRDVILELMESVAALEATGAEQTERFELLATRTDVMAEQFEVMATQMSAMATQLSAMGAQMKALTTQVNALTLGARTHQAQLGRVARLIVELAGDHQRIEGLEVRVQKLERKAG